LNGILKRLPVVFPVPRTSPVYSLTATIFSEAPGFWLSLTLPDNAKLLLHMPCESNVLDDHATPSILLWMFTIIGDWGCSAIILLSSSTKNILISALPFARFGFHVTLKREVSPCPAALSETVRVDPTSLIYSGCIPLLSLTSGA
jgi:hypothetical protein